jgi:hypothetical protein
VGAVFALCDRLLLQRVAQLGAHLGGSALCLRVAAAPRLIPHCSGNRRQVRRQSLRCFAPLATGGGLPVAAEIASESHVNPANSVFQFVE